MPRPTVLPGLLIALLLGSIATGIGYALPLLGGPVAGVLLGIVCAGLFGTGGARLAPGIRFSGSRLLQTAVVLLGAQVSLSQVLTVGWQSLPVMIGTLAACLVAAWGFGRLLGIDSELTALVGVGTAICGASAIAATIPIIKPAASKAAYALSTVFVFNIAAVLLFLWLGTALGMSEVAFGIFAGTAVNDTSSVVAAATVYGTLATDTAVVVKLARTLMIIPIAVGLSLMVSRRDPGSISVMRTPWRLVPWFLVGFLVMAGAQPFLPSVLTDGFALLAVFLITVALSAIGLSTDFSAILRTGVRPLALGGLLWLVVTGSSLAIQHVTMGLDTISIG